MSGARLPGAPETERIVLHVDMDCFYAACERLREPSLEGVPVVVGMGYESGGEHGAVATASYEAREHGVESAQPISHALERLQRADADSPAGNGGDGDGYDGGDGEDGEKGGVGEGGEKGDGEVGEVGEKGDDGEGGEKGDDGEGGEKGDDGEGGDDGPVGYYRPVDIAYYKEVSRDVRAVLHEVADVVREVSIDEAYLDVTDQVSWAGAPVFARSLKQRIEERAGVPASIGVAPNMSAAKLASDYDKPDGLVVVEPDELRSFLAPIPIDDVHGVGPVTARKLREMGIETAGDLANADRDALSRRFGEHGRDLHDRARGIDPRPVEPVGDPKSLSSESSISDPTDDPERIRERLHRLADEVCERAEARDALYKTIGIKVVTPPFDVHTRARSLSGPVADRDLVGDVVADLIEEFVGTEVRKLGVRVSNLSFAAEEQASLDTFEPASDQPAAATDAEDGPGSDDAQAAADGSDDGADGGGNDGSDDGDPGDDAEEMAGPTGHLDRRYRHGQLTFQDFETG